jgi:DNA-binding CsgD family transcriptional regulator
VESPYREIRAFFLAILLLNNSMADPHNNKIFQQAMAAVEKQNAQQSKPGPKGEAVWGVITKRGIVVGRKKVIVPPDEVEHLASLGCTDKEIADYFDVSESTMRYNFSVYLTKGRHQLRTTLRQAQLRHAINGNAALLIWLGKNILGQSDTGLGSDSNKILPWTDDEVIDADIAELDDEDTNEEHTSNRAV